ncbi:hypothetical protein [Variovorax paradoxus]|uniref:ATP-dependent DNA ligase n=1 Tax=Variovorax paradoxus TaxID=34073 RepID=UPI0024812BC4|nr:hypothetical protein [Variovorax paradoxus]WGT63725.1 hypothetical protein QHG62_27475 [Variovorax paradoxus]
MRLDERLLDLAEPGAVYALKMDGYRILAEFDGAMQLRTRLGTDATTWFPEITHSLGKHRSGQCVVDGEAYVFDEVGRSGIDQLRDRGIRGSYPRRPERRLQCLPSADTPRRRSHAAATASARPHSPGFSKNPRPYLMYVDPLGMGAVQLSTDIGVPRKLACSINAGSSVGGTGGLNR